MIYKISRIILKNTFLFVFIFLFGNNLLTAQASKVKILPKLAKGEVYNIKYSFSKNQNEISQNLTESDQTFQVERDYEDVPFEATEEEEEVEAVKPIEYILKVVDENKDFYTCNLTIKDMDPTYIVGDLSKQLPMYSQNNNDLKILLLSYNDSAYLDFKVYKNDSRIEILNFNQTSQRLIKSNLNFVNKFKEIVFQPLMDSYKSLYSNYNNYITNNAQPKRFEILFEGFEEEIYKNPENEPDFAKIMEFSLLNMFSIMEYNLTSDLKNEKRLINTRYTVLDMIFSLNNNEIIMGNFFTINLPVESQVQFHNVGVHTLKSTRLNDTILLSGSWFLSDDQKIEMKNNLTPYFETFFNDIYSNMGLEEKVILDEEILKKEVEGKGDIKIKYNPNSFMPYYFSKTIISNSMLEESSFTFEITVQKE